LEGWDRRLTGNKRLDFGGHLDHDADPGIFLNKKTRFLRF